MRGLVAFFYFLLAIQFLGGCQAKFGKKALQNKNAIVDDVVDSGLPSTNNDVVDNTPTDNTSADKTAPSILNIVPSFDQNKHISFLITTDLGLNDIDASHSSCALYKVETKAILMKMIYPCDPDNIFFSDMDVSTPGMSYRVKITLQDNAGNKMGTPFVYDWTNAKMSDWSGCNVSCSDNPDTDVIEQSRSCVVRVRNAGIDYCANEITTKDCDPFPPRCTVIEPEKVICDPFSGDTGLGSKFGLSGEIRYMPSNKISLATSPEAFVTNGNLVPATLFLNQVNVPTKMFDSGFETQSGSVLTDENGNKLVEYFSLHLKSSLVLAPGQAAGNYQLAMIADDGSNFKLLNANGGYDKLFGYEGLTSARFTCASSPISLQAGRAVPFQLNYYQGPRYHIAVMLLWRPVNANTPAESLCNVNGDGASTDPNFWFNLLTTPSTPTSNFNALLSRGWKVVAPENFLLQSGQQNQCVNE